MIPLFKVRMSPDAKEQVGYVLDSGYIGEGPKVQEFEQKLMKKLGLAKPPVVLNSCTSALTLALYMAGVRPGDEVITTPITCTATNSPIVTMGATIVWADVDPITGNIDPKDVQKKITERTKAIIAVDWGGRTCDYEELRKIAEDSGVVVIQDAAHGPLVFDFRFAAGHMVCLSFQAIKHLTTGDGGALIFNQGSCDGADINRARLLRWYGLDRFNDADFRCAQDISEVGFKYHMNDINATIGLENLHGLRTAVDAHKDNAYTLWRGLISTPLTLPIYDNSCQYWVFTVLTRSKEERDKLKEYLAKAGVMSSQVHARNDKHSAFKYNARNRHEVLVGASYFDDRQLNLPCGWWLNQDDLGYIIKSVREFYESV
jgi:dTDP-4-amino-4,6-dideoxygalactose transaminase